MRTYRLVPAILLALALSVVNSWAEEATPTQTVQRDLPVLDIPADEFNRGTPRRSLTGYLTAAQDRDFDTAAEYLDLRNLPAPAKTMDGATLARGLAVVIERELWVDFEDLSDHPEGARGDGLPDYRDRFAELTSKDGPLDLLLQRVPRGDGVFVWKVSNKTVAQIPALYDEFGYGRVEESLIENLPDITILNIELFKWVIVLGSALIAYPLLLLLLRLVSAAVTRKASPHRQLVREFLTGPFLWLLLIMVMNHVTFSLGLGIEAQRFADAHTIDITIVTWVLLSATNLFRNILRDRLESQGKKGAVVLLRPIGNAVKILFVLLAILLWISNLGFNITALLAGLGVGGIAVALALQKPLEDLFGAISMYTLQPVKVGDYCQFGDIEGTVEEIGLRTTRIRTRGHSVVSIPNARISSDIVDNYSLREHIWYHPKLTLRYDSTAEQLREILLDIREFLVEHVQVVEDPCRVRLTDFGKEGFELDVFAYVTTSDFEKYLEIAEELNLAIIDIITKSGTDFAVPVHMSEGHR